MVQKLRVDQEYARTDIQIRDPLFIVSLVFCTSHFLSVVRVVTPLKVQ